MLFTSDRSRLMQTVHRVFFFLHSLNPTFPNSYSDFLEISAEARKGCVYECMSVLISHLFWESFQLLPGCGGADSLGHMPPVEYRVCVSCVFVPS